MINELALPHGAPLADVYCYVDTAIGGPQNRNRVVRLDEFAPPPDAVNCFRTFCRFSNDLVEHAAATPSVTTGKPPSVRGYPGPGWAPFLPLDFDCAGDPARAVQDAWFYVWYLSVDLDVPKEAFRLFWSGSKGISVEVPGALFGGFAPGPDVAEVLRRLAVTLCPTVATLDTKIYDKLRLWRVPNTRHASSGLYKIPLIWEELRNGDLDAIRELARAPRELEQASDDGWAAIPTLVDYYKKACEAPAARPPTAAPPVPPGDRVPAETLVRWALARSGQGRNNAGFDLAVQLRDNGYTQAEAEVIVAQDFRKRVLPVNQHGEIQEYTEAEALGSIYQAYSRQPRAPWQRTGSEEEAGPPAVTVTDEIELRAVRSWRERHRVMADVHLVRGEEPVHGDVLKLDSAPERRQFAKAASEHLDGAVAAGALEQHLLQLLNAVEQALANDAAHAGGHDNKTQADRLAAIADHAVLFHDPLNDPYARISVNGHEEVWAIGAKGFRRWLVGEYYHAFGTAPGSQAIADALHVFEAKAGFDGECAPVYVRVAPDGQGGLYLDLGDVAWRAIHITAAGWEVVANPPVHFRRAAGMLPLPEPVRGGQLDELRALINVGDEEAWILLKAWLAAALSDRGPYPVLSLHGEQGSAKSTTARMLRRLVDPAKPPLRSTPREMRDLAIAARGNWVVSYDNVSYIQPWLSDALCQLATGGGFATRQLYSDFDEALFDAQRPILLTGITTFITRGDLLDRTIQVTLPEIPSEQRREEAEVWAAFEAAGPRLLGALLDTVVGALRERPHVELAEKPRMADFAMWAVAAERGRGEPERFTRAYSGVISSAHEQAVEGSVIGPALLDFLAKHAAYLPWECTARLLLDELNRSQSDSRWYATGWPRSPKGLSDQLRRLAPALRGLGYQVTFLGRQGHSRARMISIEKVGKPSQSDAEAADAPDQAE